MELFRSKVKRNPYIGREFQCLVAEQRNCCQIFLTTSRNYGRKIMHSIRIRTFTEVEPVQPVQMNIHNTNTYGKDLSW